MMLRTFCIFILLQAVIASSVSLTKRGGISASFLQTLLGISCGESHIAFHAYLSSSKCYSNLRPIIFDRVPVNQNDGNGGGYNGKTGIFVVPKTGLYAMTWTVAADHRTWFRAELVVDGHVEGVVMADSNVGGRASGIHPATGFVLTNLNHASHVFIRFLTGYGCKIVSSSYTRSTFSGWLMNA